MVLRNLASICALLILLQIVFLPGLALSEPLDVTNGLGDRSVKDLSLSSDGKVAIVLSRDGVALSRDFNSARPTWMYPLLEDPDARSVFVNPVTTSDLLVGGPGTIFRSGDSGDSWSLAASFGTPYRSVYDFASDPSVPSRMYAAIGTEVEIPFSETGDLMISTNGGGSWSGGHYGLSLSKIIAASGGWLFLGLGTNFDDSTGGIDRLLDGTSQAISQHPHVRVTSLVVDPEDPTNLYVSGLQYLAFPAAIYRSVNSGLAFTKVGMAGLDQVVDFRLVAVGKNHEVFLATQDRTSEELLVLRSADRGESWSEYFRGIRGERPSVIDFKDRLVIGTSAGLRIVDQPAASPPTPTATSVPTIGPAVPTVLRLKSSPIRPKRNQAFTLRGTLTIPGSSMRVNGGTATLTRLNGRIWRRVKSAALSDGEVKISRLRVRKTTQFQLTWTPPDATTFLEPAPRRLTVKIR